MKKQVYLKIPKTKGKLCLIYDDDNVFREISAIWFPVISECS